jgi:uncharacterized protein YjdB
VRFGRFFDEQPVISRRHQLGNTLTVGPASVEISPSTASVGVDRTVTLSATVKDANGYSIPVAEGDAAGLSVRWATSASDVATATGSKAGSSTGNYGGTATVKGIAAGTATITGTAPADDDSGNVSGTATITVTESN